LIIGERLKILRESKKLSQADMETRTGLLRCYTSRVENGHTVPSVKTLEKYAHALEIPLYQLFYEESGTPKPLHLPRSSESGDGVSPDEWRKFVHHLGRMNAKDRRTLYFMAQKMARPQSPRLHRRREISSKRAR
jgi:transcriptional regulator with XRE-family HTH domain